MLYERVLKFKDEQLERIEARASTQDVLIGSYRELYYQYMGSYHKSSKDLSMYIEYSQECRCGGQLNSRRLVVSPGPSLAAKFA